jgi:hypothetical protein
MKQRTFHVGEAVLVRSPEEILSTLDENGTLDGLPFMPEMLEACGRPFRIQRRTGKICVDGHALRRFAKDDVVILDGPRCDGSGHDGCKHGCRILWKEAWLRRADDGPSETPSADTLAALRTRLKIKADAQRYFCQSTELLGATDAFHGSRRLLTIRIALREIRSGDLSISTFLVQLVRWVAQKWRRAIGEDDRLRGSLKRTPNEVLGLKPGERVRVKDRDAIAKTLNADLRNRGLAICLEMTRCCGKEAEVRSRVDRLIDERTGIMREISDTVTLANVGGNHSLAEECLCKGQLGDCPRGEIMYWREIWLERLPSGSGRTDC